MVESTTKIIVTKGGSVIKPQIVESVLLSQLVKEFKQEPFFLSEARQLAMAYGRGEVDKEAVKRHKRMNFPAFVPCVSNALHGGVVIVDFGVIQVDIDFTKIEGNREQAKRVKDFLIDLGVFTLVGISASSYGVKGLLRLTNPSKEAREKILSRLEERLKEEGFHSFKVDRLPYTQACYFPYDNNLYYNAQEPAFNNGSPPASRFKHRPKSQREGREETTLPSSEEFLLYRLKKALNVALKKYGSIESHQGRLYFSWLCYHYGISEEESFHYGEREQGLGIDFQEYKRRWKYMDNKADFGAIEWKLKNEFMQMKKRQREYMAKRGG